MRYITPIDLKRKIDQNEPVQIIDTRDPQKFAECHIEGAINIPSIDLPGQLTLIEHAIPVIIYCQYGIKSDAPYLYLREKQKFKNIYILEGGIYQWANDIDQSMPVF
jgi:rhodanese-related sulfurtransferase